MWTGFALVVLGESWMYWGQALAPLAGVPAALRVAAWIAWAAFTAFTIRCGMQEDMFESIGKIGRLHWGRQVGMDLYIGFTLFVGMVYLVERSILRAGLWLVIAYLFGNMATLLYVAIHFAQIVSMTVR
jgi:hypothetical protein